jgi:hypothetical protein
MMIWGNYCLNNLCRFTTLPQIQNSTNRYSPPLRVEVNNVWRYISTATQASRRAQGHLYRLPVPNYCFELSGAARCTSPRYLALLRKLSTRGIVGQCLYDTKQRDMGLPTA